MTETIKCHECHRPMFAPDGCDIAVCNECGDKILDRAHQRQKRIEARFERLTVHHADSLDWAMAKGYLSDARFGDIWRVAELAEDFLDGKRGK